MTLYQACTNSGLQMARAIKYRTVATNVCGPSVRNLLYVTLLTHRILRWPPLVLGKICEPLVDTKLPHTVPCNDVTSPHYNIVLAVTASICKCVREILEGHTPHMQYLQHNQYSDYLVSKSA